MRASGVAPKSRKGDGDGKMAACGRKPVNSLGPYYLQWRRVELSLGSLFWITPDFAQVEPKFIFYWTSVSCPCLSADLTHYLCVLRTIAFDSVDKETGSQSSELPKLI